MKYIDDIRAFRQENGRELQSIGRLKQMPREIADTDKIIQVLKEISISLQMLLGKDLSINNTVAPAVPKVEVKTPAAEPRPRKWVFNVTRNKKGFIETIEAESVKE